MSSKKLVLWAVSLCLTCAMGAKAQRRGIPSARTDGPTVTEPDSLAPQPQVASSAQTNASAQASVPRLIRFSGALQNLSGRAIAGPVDVTFSLYAEEAGGAPLWFETQTVQADALGHYSALLGAMSPAGVPVELFTEGQARWLGVQVANLPEQSRVLLVSVPYALKAGDAETLGGKPAAAYQLTPDSAASTDSSAKQGTTTTRGGKKITSKSGSPTPQTVTATQNYIPVMTDNAGSLGNSVMYQSSGFIGVGTTAPAFPFDLNNNVFAIGPKSSRPGAGGTMRFRDDSGTVRWLFGVPGTAGSQDFFMYNYANGHAPIYIQNGAASYSLYLNGNGNVGVGTTSPTTKLDVSGNMRVVSGASIASTPQLALGGMGFVGLSSGTPPIVAMPGQTLALQSDPAGAIAYTADGGSTFPFWVNSAGKATFNGTVNLPQTTGASVGVIAIGGTPFLHACCTALAYNLFVGGAGNFTASQGSSNTGIGNFALTFLTTGSNNTASGFAALQQISSGTDNTADGRSALVGNSSGGQNTAIGSFALSNNTTGVEDTAVGYVTLNGNNTGSFNTAVGGASGGGIGSGQYNTSLGYAAGASGNFNNSTAIGALARAGANNTIVLGSINGVNGATSNVNVGIGTTTPSTTLQVAGGDVSTTTAGKGVIVKSPDGTKCARIGIDNSGTLVATSVTCP